MADSKVPRAASTKRVAATQPLGAHVVDGGVRFAVWSSTAERFWVSLFDGDGYDEQRFELTRGEDGVFSATVPGAGPGTRYGFRADGRYQPEKGYWFDPAKLLTDPYAVRIDWPYRHNALMAAPRWQQADTAAMMPKAIVTPLPEPAAPAAPLFRPGGLIYELNVRAFTRLHPAVPEDQRGTLAALRHPAVLDHLVRLGVSAVELMPVTAWIDERHLQPLGLRNAWGYNPVGFMALDPRLAPGGIGDLAETVAALRDAGIGVILDLVFNHTGESDGEGPTLSLRGIDNRAYYRRVPGRPGTLVNDTGTGNTLACDHPMVERLVLDALRHFVLHAGVDGFRFDLATVLGRVGHDFDAKAPLLAAIAGDPVLAGRVLIAEPWDIGHGGYQLGAFSSRWLEWNDRFRDDVRRFWRGDRGAAGSLATRLAGSSDVYRHSGATATRSVNFLAAHDGMTLADVTAYERKHNEANGEQNRDGHNENFSWNNGVEGDTALQQVNQRRAADRRALLATLFASRGTIMLTAGDEFGRTQHGNNNAYAQDNPIGWIDWTQADTALLDFACDLSAVRHAEPALAATGFLSGEGEPVDVAWFTERGVPMAETDWHDPDRHRLTMVLACGDGGRLAVLVNGDRRATLSLLPARAGWRWIRLMPAAPRGDDGLENGRFLLDSRSVTFARERPEDRGEGR